MRVQQGVADADLADLLLTLERNVQAPPLSGLPALPLKAFPQAPQDRGNLRQHAMVSCARAASG